MKLLIKVNTILLLTTLTYAQIGIPKESSIKYIFKKDTVVFIKNTKLYNITSFSSKKDLIIKKIAYRTLIDTKYIKGYDYPWYKIKEGWVNNPYVLLVKSNKNINFIKEVENKRTSNTKEKSIKVKENKQIEKNLIVKNNIKINKEEKQNRISNKRTNYNNFIGISYGYSTMKVDKTDINGNLQLGREVDTKASNITAEAGVRYPNYFYTLSYTNINYNDVEIDNFLISANKRFKNILNPYIGIVAGLSFIELTKTHINSSIPKATSKAVTYGVQSGIEYKISNNFFIHPSIQYLAHKHNTTLYALPAKANLSRKHHLNFNIGIRYDLY